MALLEDCRRVLKPRGLFKVSVPDASIYVYGYLNHESFDWAKYFVHKAAVISDTRKDILNYMAYMDGQHRYMFDQGKSSSDSIPGRLCLDAIAGFRSYPGSRSAKV